MAMFTASPRKIEDVPDLEDLSADENAFNERVQSLASSRGRNFQSDGIDQGIIDLDALAATANTPLVEVVANVGVELDYAATANTPLFEVVAIVGVEELDLQKKYEKMLVSNLFFLLEIITLLLCSLYL